MVDGRGGGGLPVLVTENLRGSFNSGAIFSGLSFSVCRRSHVNLINLGNANGAALTSVLFNDVRTSGNAVRQVGRPYEVNCLRRSTSCSIDRVHSFGRSPSRRVLRRTDGLNLSGLRR